MFWNSLAKAVSTITMWIFLSAVSIVALAADTDTTGQIASQESLVPLVIVPLIIALIGTFVIWGLPEVTKNKDAGKLAAQLDESAGKAKRQAGSRQEERLALLLEMMDEDEREAFKASLKRQVLEDAAYHDTG